MSDQDLSDEDYATLASFRWELRRFLDFSERAARSAGLTAQQYQALLAIRAAAGATMLVGELAEQLLVRPHSATGLVDRLEATGLVARVPTPGDRRHVRIALTEHAAGLLASLAASHRVEVQRLRPMLLGLTKRL